MSSSREADDLVALLHRIDGRGYTAYKELGGAWEFSGFSLSFDHVQGDPFADPSRVRVEIPPERVRLHAGAYANEARRWGTAALLARAFRREADDRSRRRGSGRSGTIRMESLGQLVLPQTAVQVDEEGGVEARFAVGLPAKGRRIAGREAVELITADVVDVVQATLVAESHTAEEVERWAAANEDGDALRSALTSRGLVAFVADGARLPRRSGVDDRPLDTGDVVPFASPPSLRVTIPLPNAGPVSGMGVPSGVTLIVGGGFHGKSTVLRALQSGVFNHAPGDGRERVASRADTVKVRAEDGRSVVGVDITPFIDGLPFERDTTAFATENASGSTSQAASIVEAWEAGARVLLVDEDTSATNFMIRDRRMQVLVPPEAEPITPFVDSVRLLHGSHKLSTVLVLGGSGDYLDEADCVIRMRDYLPEDVTDEARDVARRLPTGRRNERSDPPTRPASRRPVRSSIDSSRGRRSTFVKVPDDRTLLFGGDTVDLAAVEQLMLRSQTRPTGMALALLPSPPPQHETETEHLDGTEQRIRSEGLDVLGSRRLGTLAAFRRFELASALNRLRSLEIE